MNSTNIYTRLMCDMRKVGMILLSGGKGSRLSPLTDYFAKPYLPIGGKSRIIDFSLFNAIHSDIKYIFPILQYASAGLNRHISELNLSSEIDSRHVIPLHPSHRDGVSKFTGTAHAVYECMPELDHYPEIDYFLIAPADHVYKMDYRNMMQAFLEMENTGVDFMIAGTHVPISEASEYGVMNINNDDILIGFDEKPEFPATSPHRSNESLVSMGIYLCRKDFLYSLIKKDALDTQSKHDFGKNIIPKLLTERPGSIGVYDFCSHTIEGENGPFWMDVGRIGDYFEAQMRLMDIVPALNMNNKDWQIFVGDGNIPPAKLNPLRDNMTGFETRDELITIDSRMRDWVQIIPKMLLSGRTVIDGPANLFGCVFSKNCRVGRFTRANRVIIHRGDTIGEECSIYNTIIMSGCTIPDFSQIGFNEKQDNDKNIHIDKVSGVRVITPNSVL